MENKLSYSINLRFSISVIFPWCILTQFRPCTRFLFLHVSQNMHLICINAPVYLPLAIFQLNIVQQFGHIVSACNLVSAMSNRKRAEITEYMHSVQNDCTEKDWPKKKIYLTTQRNNILIRKRETGLRFERCSYPSGVF